MGQIDTGAVTERESNPVVHGVEVTERLRCEVEDAVERAMDWSRNTSGEEVAIEDLVDFYFEAIKWSRQVPKAEQEGILALLDMEYSRQKMAMQIGEQTSKAKCVQGSMGEKAAKEDNRAEARVEANKPDKTAMLLKSVVRKDKEIRSKEPKIPWQ